MAIEFMAIETTKRRVLGPLTRAVALACGLSALGAAPAAAQWFGFNDGPMPPGAIVRGLMQQGFAEIGRPRFNGRVYVVEGVNARGVPVRLVIDAYDGGVLSRTRLEASLLPPREVAPPRDFAPRGRFGSRFEEAEEFAPPRRIPGPDRYDPREAEPRRAERPEPFGLRRTEPRRGESLDAYDPRELELRRAERPDLRQAPNRPARNEAPALEDPSNPSQGPARAAAKPPAEPTNPQISVETSPPAAKPADPPATTAAIAPTPPVVQPEPAAPAASAEPAPAKPVETAKPSGPEQPSAASSEPPKRTVRVIEGVTPVGPPAR